MYTPSQAPDLQLLGLALSPDGRRLVTTGADGHVGLWAWSRGRPLGAGPLRLTGHRGPARCPVFSGPGRVVTAGEDGTVRVWDVGRGQEAAVLRGHRGPVHCVAVAANAPRAASASQDGTVRVWDLARPGAATAVLRGHAGEVRGVALSPDGRLAASAGADGTVRLWHLDGAGAPRVLHTGPDAVAAIAFDRVGGLAAGDDDGVVRYWARPTSGGPVVLDEPAATPGAVRSIGFLGDGELMAVAHASGNVVRWFRAGGFRESLWGMSPTGGVSSVVADEDHLVAVRTDGGIASWSTVTDSGVTVHDTLQGPWLEAYDAGARTWRSDTDTPPPWQTDDIPASTPGFGGPVALDGTRGAVAGWDDSDGRLHVRPAPGTPRDVSAPSPVPIILTFSPDGGSFLAADDPASGGDSLTTYALPSLQRLASADGFSAAPWAAALGPGGRHAARPGPNGDSIEVADRQSEDRILLPGHSSVVTALAFGGDGTLFSAAIDGVRSWDVTGRRELAHRQVPPGAEINALAVSADGARVAAGTSDGAIRVWRRGDGNAPAALRGHRGRVTGLAFAARSGQLVSAGADGTVRVWPDETTDPLVFTCFEDVAAVAASPDGQRLAVAHATSGARVVTTWRCLECRTSTADLVALAEARLARMRD
jgi:WD40 repeat protein